PGVPRGHQRGRSRRVSSCAGGASVDFRLRRDRVSARLPEVGADALVVTRLPNVRYLTGFTGSNGQLLLASDDGTVFLSDGRYTEQARREVPDLKRGTYRSDFPKAFEQACGDAGVRRVAFESTGM